MPLSFLLTERVCLLQVQVAQIIFAPPSYVLIVEVICIEYVSIFQLFAP